MWHSGFASVCSLIVAVAAVSGCDEDVCLRNSDCASGLECFRGSCRVPPASPDGGASLPVDGGGEPSADGPDLPRPGDGAVDAPDTDGAMDGGVDATVDAPSADSAADA